MAKRKTRPNINNELMFDSLVDNNMNFRMYLNRAVELSMSMFDWQNLPDTMSARWIELNLFNNGNCIVFEDEVMGLLSLSCKLGGRFNVYNIPTDRQAYAANGYNKSLTDKDSVIIYNNMLHTNSYLDVLHFAKRLWDYDRIIDVNINAQKTPVLILADDNERLTMQQVYKKYSGTEPFIFGTKNFDIKNISVLNTEAPFLADKIYQIKQDIWNEMLTYLGIPNVTVNKKERLITDEVERGQGGVLASRYSRLSERQNAADAINRMFGTDIKVVYRDGLDVSMPEGGVNNG